MAPTAAPAAASRHEMIIAKIWYFLYSGSLVFFIPYIPLFLKRDLHWEPWRVGLINGLRPWISAPCSLLICSLADRLKCHRQMLVACYVTSFALRGALALVPSSFGAVAALVLLGDALAAPCPVIADSTVVAKCSRDGDYGKQRVFASIGWGTLSTVAGALISHTNVKWGMLVYVCMCVPNVAAAWLVTAPSKPTESQSNEGGSAKEDAGGAAADKLAAKAGAKEETGDAAAAKNYLISAITEKAAAAETDSSADPAPAVPSSGGVAAPAALVTDQGAAEQRPQQYSPAPRHARHPTASFTGADLRAQLLAASVHAAAQAVGDHSITGGAAPRAAAAVSGAAAAAADAAAASGKGEAPGVWSLLRQPRVMTFLMRALMIGYGLGTQQSFTFLLVQQMGGTELLMGVMLLGMLP
ncbi:hypothetical protein MNEG_10987 [Monoraphidium neglectum]|uniref:Major facilitator superfamily associated domain-containing protein n=1 Tax=Monoraphidium neglectum TaxID=145388 RepID=A0A0D2MQS7_9CHLO|nr:hypothetical protein MNEG_10987 [Monoraphidium neglectum]KIY96975.1 hypothetical protein MNEG_10987 [Monoraphidium neglectum]|eukprot:XP_013895995.1 hypothetical protein MNEG_10987 [Monoraphidium neglectum]